jgi:hypothetical protein
MTMRALLVTLAAASAPWLSSCGDELYASGADPAGVSTTEGGDTAGATPEPEGAVAPVEPTEPPCENPEVVAIPPGPDNPTPMVMYVPVCPPPGEGTNEAS